MVDMYFHSFIFFVFAIHSTKGWPELSKCCLEDQLVTKNKNEFVCVDHNSAIDKVDFSYITIFDDLGTSEKKVVYNSIFDVTSNKFKNPNFRKHAKATAGISEARAVYMTENAVLRVNMSQETYKFGYHDFCVDFFRSAYRKVTYSTFWYSQNVSDNYKFLTASTFVSCGFLLAVLIVYGLLSELRNMCGCILIAYITSLLLAFLNLAIIRMKVHSTNVCYNLTLVVYYTFLASFCWMTVMSYDIWWTFRGYAKSRPIHRRGRTFKFVMYSIYAWGIPLAMTVFLACIDKADLQPWFIKPNLRTGHCFLDDREKLRYLYIPMLILIGANWMFYLMTAFNIWRLSRGTAVLDSAAAGTPAAHRTQRQRFLVYLKLSVVMGLNWVLEVASYQFPDIKVWYITDAYNILIGVFIFIIFVCKKKILKKLIRLFFKQTSKSQGTPSNSRSNNTSETQETQPLQVCANPNGPRYVVNNF